MALSVKSCVRAVSPSNAANSLDKADSDEAKDKANQDKDDQDKADQDKADQDKADQDKADQDKSDQVKADQDKANLAEGFKDSEPKTALNETNQMAQDIYRKIREWYQDGELLV